MLLRSITPYIVCVIERFGSPALTRRSAVEDTLLLPSRSMDRGGFNLPLNR